ncbi:MAG: DUF4340 domain-containing protein, partial [Lachnospiraceae bacterium]|nr:DUF4340 domain-containing protein [Lachnospiraceae bacterium]
HRDSEGNWLYDDDEAFPVNQEAVNDLVSVFNEFGVSFVIKNASDLSQYGLDNPEGTIRLTADGKETEVLCGTFSTMDEKRYVSVNDGNVYLVNHDPLEDYEVELSDLIRHDTIPATGLSGSKTVTFSGAENYTIDLQQGGDKSSNPDDIYFTEDRPLSTSLVTTLITKIRGLGLKDYVSYNASAEELASYGLDTPALTIRLDYPVTDEDDNETMQTFVLNLGQNREELAAALEEIKAAEDSEEDSASSDPLSSVTCYARVGDSQIVYKISNSDYNALSAVSYNDLRHREVANVYFDDLTGIEITLDGESYTLTSETTEPGEEDEEAVKTWYYQDAEIESTSELASALSGLKAADAESFTDETPDGKEEIALKLSINSAKFPEAEIRLYRYDGSSCIAAVDGKTLCFVPRSEVVDLIEAVNAIVLN